MEEKNLSLNGFSSKYIITQEDARGIEITLNKGKVSFSEYIKLVKLENEIIGITFKGKMVTKTFIVQEEANWHVFQIQEMGYEKDNELIGCDLLLEELKSYNLFCSCLALWAGQTYLDSKGE